MVTTLDERVSALEKQVEELRTVLQKSSRAKDWQRTVGMFTGDNVMKRIDKAARHYREVDRAKVRRRPARTKRPKR
jgi:hypothetical protein